jgi:predicted nucleic acid-binding protein
MIRIVDASAIGAVMLVEPEGTWVNEQTDGMELLASAILPFEVGNIFWKRMRQSGADTYAISTIWAAWSSLLPVRLVTPDPSHTLRLAYETGLTFYDASYVRVAQDHAADLISLDRRLVHVARRLGLRAPAPHTTPRTRN